MHVSMYVCNACIYVMYVPVCVYMYVRMFACMYVCVCKSTVVRARAHTHTLQISGSIPPLPQTPL